MALRTVLLCLGAILLLVTLIPPTHAAFSGQQILIPSKPWEASIMWRPVVINTRTSFLMWYSGENRTGVDSIGLATSTDGIVWTKYPRNPVLSPGSTGQWDAGSVNEAWVIRQDGGYKMWYTGESAGSGSTSPVYAIGYATSPDGIHWTKYSGNPVFTSAGGTWDNLWVLRPMILPTNSSYTMYYIGANEQNFGNGLAASKDGVHWAREDVTIALSQDGWDSSGNDLSSVTVAPGGYLFAYEGWSGKASSSTPALTNYAIGFASSTDGVTTTPFPGNPVVTNETGFSNWESNGVGYPMVIVVGGNYFVYYAALSGTSTYSLGLAIIPTSQFPVPEFSTTQLLMATTLFGTAALLLTRQPRKAVRW